MSVTVKSELEVDTKSKIMEPCRSDITKLELEDDEIEDTKQKGPSINDVIFSLIFYPSPRPTHLVTTFLLEPVRFRIHTYTHSVLIRNGLIRNTSEIFGF